MCVHLCTFVAAAAAIKGERKGQPMTRGAALLVGLACSLPYAAGFAVLSSPSLMSSTSLFGSSSSAPSSSSSSSSFRPRTLYDKIFDDHAVYQDDRGNALIYIDRHLVHEVTSPQAFEGLMLAGRGVRRPDCTLCTVDHNVPTDPRSGMSTVESFITELASRQQVMKLDENVKSFSLPYFDMTDERQGIVHIIGPEQGFTLPGSTTVCGDSHTATHGAFGSLAFGIGTSEVEHVLATSTLHHAKARNYRIDITGLLSPGVTPKDVVLHVCGLIGTAGGTGHVIEFAGGVMSSMSMEGRMSMSNMAIEAGARAGLVAPDETTFNYLKGRPMAPDEEGGAWDRAVEAWREMRSDPGAHYDKVLRVKGEDIFPTVTWGTSPQDVVPISGLVPDPASAPDSARAAAMRRSLDYIGLSPGQKLEGTPVDKVFIGSCTNGRIEDMRAAAAVAYGRKVQPNVLRALVVPGSGLVKRQAEEEGLDKILVDAGFEWREPGCSMCLAMNADKLLPKERCASTSNRNFEGRQGNGGRTHLLSPEMAAAAAVSGGLADVRKFPFLGKPSEDPRLKWKVGAGSLSRVFSTKKHKNMGAVIDPVPPYLKGKVREGPAKAGAMNVANQFTTLKARSAALDIQNIDTDMIIPKEFLKTIKRSGLGFAAFAELRYTNPEQVALLGEEVAKPNPDFILNKPGYDKKQTKILVCGDNFGCGSSREHAPWSIKDMGVTCVISTSFADIFFNNCFQNGMLPIVLKRNEVEELLKDAADPENELSVDLEKQTVTRGGGKGAFTFEIDPFKKKCLLLGLDKIGLTLERVDDIARFEKMRSDKWPWLDGASMKVPQSVKMYPDAPVNAVAR